MSASFRTRLPSPPWLVGVAGTAILSYLFVGAVVEQVQFSVGLLWSQLFLFAGPTVIGVRAAGFRPLHFLRADRLPRRKLLVLGTACSAFLCASAMMGLIQSLLPESWVKQFDMTEMLTQQNGFLLYFGIIVGAPLAEEIVFRGCLLPAIAELSTPRQAVLFQAAVFALIHLDPIGFLPRFVLGIVFGLLWLDSGSLWAGVFAHALNNGVSSIVFLWFPTESSADMNVRSQLVAALLVGGGAVSLVMFLWLLRREPPAPRPLPSKDPEALALPTAGGLFNTAELRRWVRTYALAALTGLAVVGGAAYFGRPH